MKLFNSSVKLTTFSRSSFDLTIVRSKYVTKGDDDCYRSANFKFLRMMKIEEF